MIFVFVLLLYSRVTVQFATYAEFTTPRTVLIVDAETFGFAVFASILLLFCFVLMVFAVCCLLFGLPTRKC